MKIVSWNINGIRSRFNTNSLSSFIHQNPQFDNYTPDIICFQETKVSDFNKLSNELVCIKDFDSFWSFSKKRQGYSGVATFVKKGSTKHAVDGFGISEFNDEGRCIMTDHDSFVLFNVYFPNGGMSKERLDYKMRFYGAFQTQVSKLLQAGRCVIITGDVNTAHKPIDIWNPEKFESFSGFLPIEREWMDSLFQAGFYDVYRHYYPEKTGAFTFWDTRTQKRAINGGWRIDYFIASLNLTSSVKHCDILPHILGSDHCPISLDLDLNLEKSFPTPLIAGNLKSQFKNKLPVIDKNDFFKKRKSSDKSATGEISNKRLSSATDTEIL